MKLKLLLLIFLLNIKSFGQDIKEQIATYQADKSALGRKYPNSLSDLYFERIIFSLNYHLEKMKPQQCIDLLVDKVGHEPANAEAEVRRSFTGRYGPLNLYLFMKY
jgi:hypothetical protein